MNTRQAGWVMVVGAAIGMFPMLSVAQVGYEANSLEWLCAHADAVLRASVAEVATSELDTDRVTVKLMVKESLKGSLPPTQAFEAGSSLKPLYNAWKSAQSQQLWFLTKKSDREERPGNTNRLSQAGFDLWQVVPLGSAPPGEPESLSLLRRVLTMDLNVLEGPQAILSATRLTMSQAAATLPVEEHRIALTSEVMEQRLGECGTGNTLVVPVWPRLEQIAHQLLNSPSSFLALPDKSASVTNAPERDSALVQAQNQKFERDWLRREGVKVLEHFKSPANTLVLQSMLNDSASWLENRADDEDGAPPRRVYCLREAAYAALQQWGVEVEKPVLEEEPKR